MIVQRLNDVSAACAAQKTSAMQRQTLPSPSANHTDRVSISDAAKAMMANSATSMQDQEVQSRLSAIKAKPAEQRSPADMDYLSENENRFGEIRAKIEANGYESLTSDEVDYMQKAAGFVNAMSKLSPDEKTLYDELAAKGNREAAQALLLVGMSRMGMDGQQVTLPNGRSFDPTRAEVTASHIRDLFKHMFAGDTGEIDRRFDALASYLDQRDASGKAMSKT